MLRLRDQRPSQSSIKLAVWLLKADSMVYNFNKFLERSLKRNERIFHFSMLKNIKKYN